MPNIKILFCLKKSELCQEKQKVISSIIQPMKDTDFHFDTVWCRLILFVCFLAHVPTRVSCVMVRACMRIHSTRVRMSGIWQNGVWLQSRERLCLEKQTIWQQRSLLILWLAIFKCSQTKRNKKRKTKERQNWSCQFVPELSQTIPFCSQWGFLSVGSRLYISLTLSHSFHFPVWAFIHLLVWGLKGLGWTWRKEGADDKYIY